MSLKYRDNSGIETPVAGLKGTSGELVPSVALMQSKNFTVTFSSSDTVTCNVTFDAPMPDANYLCEIEGTYGNESTINALVVAKTTTGVTIKCTKVDGSATGNYMLRVTAFKLMTDTVHEADSAHIAQNTANFAPTFSEVTSYAVGDYVTYNNVLYRCTTAHTAGTWVAGHFTQVTVGGDLAQNASDLEKLKAYTSVSNTDADTLTTTGLYYLTTGCTNVPSNYCILQVQSKNTTVIGDDIAQYAISTEGNQYSRVRVNGTWSTWQKLATTTLPTLNGTCSGLADSECYATFDVTFDSWGGSSPTIIGIAVDGAYVNSKALIMVNNSIDNTSDKKVRILYADGVGCLFRVYASKSSLYDNSVKVYVAFYTSDTSTYSFKVQQKDYIGVISNLVVTNDSSGMPSSSWFQSIAQSSAPVLTTDLTSTVTSGSTAPVTSGGVYDAIVKRYPTRSLYPVNLGLATGTVALEDLCDAINTTLGSDCCIHFSWDSSSAISLNVNGTIVSLAGSVLQGHFEPKNTPWTLSEGWFTDEEGNMYSFRCRTQGGTTPSVAIKKLS